MLDFKQDDSYVVAIFTLTELVTITNPYYLFVFTHVETKAVVTDIWHESQDESPYPQRYNQFNMLVSELFDGKPTGEWHYVVCQQSDPGNTDPDQSLGVIERGKMILQRTTEFEYDMYDQSQSYKAYNG